MTYLNLFVNYFVLFDNTLIFLPKNSMDKYNKKIVMSKLLVVQK